jgi:sec-independent protein translocase protein TatA
MFGLGPTELVIIVLIAALVFGVGRLPELGGAVGKTIREFKRNVDDAPESAPHPAAPPAASPAAPAPLPAGPETREGALRREEV